MRRSPAHPIGSTANVATFVSYTVTFVFYMVTFVSYIAAFVSHSAALLSRGAAVAFSFARFASRSAACAVGVCPGRLTI